MPVGTGSINRAARTSKKAAEVKKEEVKAVVAEEAAEVKETVDAKAETEKKAAPKKTAAKKPAAKKDALKKETAKKTAVKETVQEKTAPEKAPELRVYGNETVFVVGNECCHLTEELPVHLL